jgi:hypothetical protein
MLVRLDTLEPWRGEKLRQTFTTANLHYADGRVEEALVDPYEVEVRHPPNIEDLWPADRLAGIGLVKPVAFAPLQGKVAVGAPRYERDGDQVREIYDVADAPTPPPAEPPALEELAARLSALEARVEQLKG